MIKQTKNNAHISISSQCTFYLVILTRGSDIILMTLTLPCVFFDLHQALSASLTQEQKYTVDRMVEAHRLYRAQDSSHCRVGNSVTHQLHFQNQLQLLSPPHCFLSVSTQLFEWPCMEEGESLSDVASPHLQRLLQFARTVPGKLQALLLLVHRLSPD